MEEKEVSMQVEPEEPDYEPEPEIELECGTEDHMESIILEKLKIVDKNPESNRDKIRELCDDIQILAFMEQSEIKEKSENAITLLTKHVGKLQLNTLKNLISKIAKKEVEPQPKTVKMPPSWIKQKRFVIWEHECMKLHIVN